MLSQTIAAFDLLDSAKVNGNTVKNYLENICNWVVEVKRVEGETKSTDFVRIVIPGEKGKISGGIAPTLGIIGRLGGIGARPEIVGLVSDGDGAVVTIACAMKIIDMKRNGDSFAGDVILVTHICPDAATKAHPLVQYMSSPLDAATMSCYERIPEADAILSIDTTKGNRVVNVRGFAITPTVKGGYILPVSSDLLRIMEIVSGRVPVVLPLSIQDITPYANGLSHINSLMQPSTVTDSPVIGIAITAETIVPGSATGATSIVELEQAGRFVIEVAKAYGADRLRLYDINEYDRLVKLYGSLKHLQQVPQSDI